MMVTKKLTEGSFCKNILLYAIPLILSSMLSQVYSTVDGVIAGKFIGEYSLGAISAAGSFDTLFTSLFNGFCSGFAIYLSHLFGRGHYASIKQDIVGMSVFVAMISLGISILAILFRNPILDYLKVDPMLRRDTESYFVIYTAGYVIYFLNIILLHSLHSLGVTSFSLYVSILSTVLNVAGNLLMITVFDMGVAGLAVATLLSSLAGTVCYVFLLRRAFREMASEKVSYQFNFSCVRGSLRYSVPVAIQQLTFHGVGFVISPSINALGAATTTGYNISQRIYRFGTQSLWATTSAIARYTGQCVGEGAVQKIRRGVRTGFGLVCAIVFPFVFGLMVFAEPVASLFFRRDTRGRHMYSRFATPASIFRLFISNWWGISSTTICAVSDE